MLFENTCGFNINLQLASIVIGAVDVVWNLYEIINDYGSYFGSKKVKKCVFSMNYQNWNFV